MEWVPHFLALSGALSVLSLVAALQIYCSGSTPFSWATGFLELLWIGVCAWALWTLPLSRLEQCVPIVYLTGVITATVGLNRHYRKHPPLSGALSEIPTGYVRFAIVSSAATLLLSVIALSLHERASDALPLTITLEQLPPRLEPY